VASEGSDAILIHNIPNFAGVVTTASEKARSVSRNDQEPDGFRVSYESVFNGTIGKVPHDNRIVVAPTEHLFAVAGERDGPDLVSMPCE